MNKVALVFAGIFLAITLVSPVFILIQEKALDDKDFENLGPNLADETQATEYFQAIAERHQLALTIIVIVEAVFVILFAIAIWFALKT